MNDAERRRTLERIAEQATRLAMALGVVHAESGTTVLDRIRQAEPGIRAAHFDGHRRASGVSDPTGGVVADEAETPDPTAHTMRELDRLITGLYSAEDRLWRLLGGFGPPHAPNEADRLAVARENDPGDPGCESCARVTAVDSKDPWYVEADPRFERTTVTDRASGIPRLADPMTLCTWCYDFTRRRWRLPTVREVEMHRDGKPIRMPADEETQVRIRIQARTAEHLEAVARELAAGDGPEAA